MSFRAFDLLNLVRDFGEPLTFRQVTTDGTYDPVTGTVAGVVTTDTIFTGYLYDYVSKSASEVLRGSRKCVIPSLGFAPEPQPDDLILGSGDTVKISRVVTLFSAGTSICYICDVEE